MFLDFYGMSEQPFGVTPDPRYLYLSQSHREALASLFYGAQTGRGLLALIAPPGMGKTTLLFHFLEHLQRSARTAYLFQTQCDSFGLLRYLLGDLHIDTRGQDFVAMHERLNELLLQEAHLGRRFVLVIDEAQNLDDSVLETARLLSDFETPREKLLQIVFAGQSELADKLARPELAQLRQRIGILSRLEPLCASDINGYIEHRLHVAGYKGTRLFTPTAMESIAACTQGIPRNINNVCFGALSLGCALRVKRIGADLIAEATADLDMSSALQRRERELNPVVVPVSLSRSASTIEPECAEFGGVPEIEHFEEPVKEEESGPTITELFGHTSPRYVVPSGKDLLGTFEVELVGAELCEELASTLDALRAFGRPSFPPLEFVPGAIAHSDADPPAEVENESTSRNSQASPQLFTEARPEFRNGERTESLESLNPPVSNSSETTCEFGRQIEPNWNPSKRKTILRLAVAVVLVLVFVAAISFRSNIKIATAGFSSYFKNRKAAPASAKPAALLSGKAMPNANRNEIAATVLPLTFPDDGTTVVIVQPGDDLRQICLRHIGRYNEQLAYQVSGLNRELVDPDQIYIGQRLVLPKPAKDQLNLSQRWVRTKP